MLEDVTLLGDVHLEKKFRTGVPLHRLGEREGLVWADFEASLHEARLRPYHVQVGDIFDQMCVSETAVLKTASLYRFYAERAPGTRFIIIRGNHDASRDITKKSSFDILAELLAPVPNITVFKESVGVIGDYGFLPWHPFKSSAQLAFDLVSLTKGKKLKAVFCHCDIGTFGGNDDNLIPTKILSQITDVVVTGHVHVPDTYSQDGVTVVVTGSMQPYTHNEDLTNVLYRTLTLQEFQDGLYKDDWKGLNLRILLKPGEILPMAPDCLSFIGKTVADSDPEELDDYEEEVGFNTFDMDAIFKQVMQEREVGPEVAEKINAKYSEIRYG